MLDEAPASATRPRLAQPHELAGRASRRAFNLAASRIQNFFRREGVIDRPRRPTSDRTALRRRRRQAFFPFRVATVRASSRGPVITRQNLMGRAQRTDLGFTEIGTLMPNVGSSRH